jgi:hypothetical protein
MNKKIIFSFFLLASLAMTGCSDKFLEEKKPYEAYTDVLFSDTILTNTYIAGLYKNMFSGCTKPTMQLIGAYDEERTKMTEEFGGSITSAKVNSVLCTDPQSTYLASANCPNYYPTKLENSVTNTPVSRIYNCTALIGKMRTIGKSLPEAFRQRAMGQAFFMRAVQYFDLFRVYGGVPINVAFIENMSYEEEMAMQIPRATSTEMITQIVADLDSAAKKLPGQWGTNDFGRFTRGAALAMKSRVLLTFASPLFNKNWDSDPTRWQAALDAGLAAEQQLTIDGYGLYGTSAKDWAGMFYNFDNKFCKEAIIVQLCSSANASSDDASCRNNGWESAIRLKTQGGGNGIAAPKEMIDLFPMKDGRRPTVANGYDDVHFFMDRDPRFYRTFAFCGSKWGNSQNASDTVWLYRYAAYKDAKGVFLKDKTTGLPAPKTAMNGGMSINSPAVVCKMSDPKASTTTFAKSGTDIYEYRYAELILNIAECYAALDNRAKCIEYLTKLRSRVGIPSANNYGIGNLAGKYAAIEACLYERRIELAYEGKRFWDMQRWLLYDGYCSANTTDNVLTKFGGLLSPVNGTTHTGYYWQCTKEATWTSDGKNILNPISNSDKYNAVPIVDPDDSKFATQLTALKTFFDNNFKIVPLDSPWDSWTDAATKVKNVAYVNFKPNYYLFGFQTGTITMNPWLPQTLGWNDPFSVAGTYDYQK